MATPSTSNFNGLLTRLESMVSIPWIQFLLLAIAVAVVYGHTLDVPFYFDDQASIVDNYAIHSIRDFGSIWRFSPLRFVSYFSFALNYHFYGLRVVGYHLTNILIHFLAGLAVFGLGRCLISIPAVRCQLSEDGRCWLPLLAGLFFVLHPLQTQAVTYIVQRSASLAALFYISSLACYIQARLQTNNSKRLHWWLWTILFMGLAFFTKQNTASLPLALLVAEAVFFPGNMKRLIAFFALLAVGSGIVYGIMFFGFDYTPFSLKAFDVLTRETKEISRIDYLATQTMVLWKYIRMFFLPTGLHLDHDFSIASGFANLQVIVSISGHLFFIILAIYMARRFSLFSFAVFFYYIAHLVESSLIPIKDVLFEHRTYLPNLGLCLGFALLLTGPALKRLGSLKVLPTTVLLLVILGTMTWQRNAVWLDPVHLWQDCIQKSPWKARPHNNLGEAFAKKGDMEAAIIKFQEALHLDPENVIFYLNMGNTLTKKGRPQAAVNYLEAGLRRDPHWSELNFNMGLALGKLGRKEDAIKYYRKALQADPKHGDTHNNIANLLYKIGKTEEAIYHYNASLRLNPDAIFPNFNMAAILFLKNKGNKAIPFLEKVVYLDPKDADAHILLGKIFSGQDQFAKAIKHYTAALDLMPESRGEISYKLACIYAKRNMVDESLRWLQNALSAGYDEWDHLRQDRDLDNIRNSSLFKQLMKGRE